MGLFRDSVIETLNSGLKLKQHKGIPTPLKELTKYTNYIQRGQYVIVGGRPTSGKRSFVQFNYLLHICKWVIEEFEPNKRPPVKFFYFCPGGDTAYLLQKWTCAYLKLKNQIVIDTATLNGEIGELYSLKNPDFLHVVEAIREAEEFFDEVLEGGIIEIITTHQTATSIKDQLERFMINEVGEIDHGVFKPNIDWLGYYIFYIIDDVQQLSTESYGNVTLDRQGIYRLMHSFNIELKQKFKINPVIILPVPFSSGRKIQDSLPSYKDLGVFYNGSDLGLIMYNPFNEQNFSYLGFDIKEWIFKGGKFRFRSVTIVRNKGAQNITKGLMFLEECGYFRELPVPGPETNNEQIQGFLNQLAELY